jgi:hypothetical protein
VATVIDSGRALSGSTHEPNVLGAGTLVASLAGSRHQGAVSFIKTYDKAGPQYEYPIRYEGVLNGDATEIEGRWLIGDGSSGKFLMIRSTGKAVAVERKKAVRV